MFSREERERHVYIVGKSGTGKSTFLFNLAMGDIHSGEGVAVIDPHGDLALDILDAIPRSRINDVCYLDAGEIEYPVGFNPATRIAPERRALAASGMVAAFKHLWSDSWGPRLEHFLRHGIAALISRQHATLLDLPRLYTDDAFRGRIVAKVTDPDTMRFWQEEYPSYTKQQRAEAAAPILNKAGQFTASPHLRLILGQVAPRLDLSFTMNNRRILIANLAKGTICASVGAAVPPRELALELASDRGRCALERGIWPAPAVRSFHAGAGDEELVTLLLDGVAPESVQVSIELHDAPVRSRRFLIGRTLSLAGCCWLSSPLGRRRTIFPSIGSACNTML